MFNVNDLLSRFQTQEGTAQIKADVQDVMVNGERTADGKIVVPETIVREGMLAMILDFLMLMEQKPVTDEEAFEFMGYMEAATNALTG